MRKKKEGQKSVWDEKTTGDLYNIRITLGVTIGITLESEKFKEKLWLTNVKKFLKWTLLWKGY